MLTTRDHSNPASDIAGQTTSAFAWLGKLINDSIASHIACREREIANSALRRFKDRGLKNPGTAPLPDRSGRRWTLSGRDRATVTMQCKANAGA